MKYTIRRGVWLSLWVSCLIGCGSSPPAAPVQPVNQPAPAPLKPAREKTVQFQMTGQGLILPGPIVFPQGSAQLGPANDDSLFVVVDFLEARPDVTLLRIEAHTDGDGSDNGNQGLSERRALAVAKWLISKGVDGTRLLPVGFGDNKPIAFGDDPQSKAVNRRIMFKAAAVNGRAVGGQPVDGGGKIAGYP